MAGFSPDASTLPSGCSISVALPALSADTNFRSAQRIPSARMRVRNDSNCARSPSSIASRAARASSAAFARIDMRAACSGVGTSSAGS